MKKYIKEHRDNLAVTSISFVFILIGELLYYL